VPKELDHGESGCEANPDPRPSERDAKVHALGAPIENSQIERQHRDHEQIEENPKDKHWRNITTSDSKLPRPCQRDRTWRLNVGDSCACRELLGPGEIGAPAN